jgi:hypothetical protein
MHELLRRKMLALRTATLSAHADSKFYPSAVSGREREVFLSSLLCRLLPPNFRVGSGVITDHMDATTGQIDLVVELPLSLSFPVVGENRLYFADTVGAAFEVKSDLAAQWDEVVIKQREVNSLLTKVIDPAKEMHLHLEYKVPFFVVAYKGPKRLSTIEKKLDPRRDLPPAGIYIIESNLFIGHSRDGWVESKTEAGAMLAFIMSLYQALHGRQSASVDFWSFIKA